MKISALVAVLLVAGFAVGYQQLLARACSGLVTVRVAAAPTVASTLAGLASGWGASEPATSSGACAQVVVQSRDSAEVAAVLVGGGEDTEPPHVWVPEATAWAHKAATLAPAAAVLPTQGTSLARSPMVVALPQPVAEALGWQGSQLADQDWHALLEQVEQAWDEHARDDWGRFRFGMSDPTRDTAGLLSVSATVTGEDNDADELRQLHDRLDSNRYHRSIGQLLDGLREHDGQGPEAVADYLSAFPALERQVLEYNRSNPQVPLVAIYPAGDGPAADYPYLVLTGAWGNDTTAEVAAAFLEHLRSPAAQDALRQAGLRDVDQQADTTLTGEYGLLVDAAVAAAAPVPQPEPLALAVDRWTALTRPTNLLIVVDTSGSLDQPLADGSSGVELVGQATDQLADLLTDDDQVGLWVFTGEEASGYESLVSLGRLDVAQDGTRTRRQQLRTALEDAPIGQAGAPTGWHASVQAAYDTVLGNFDPAANNLVLLVTDAATSGAEPVETLVDYLQGAAGPDQQVRLMVVSVGDTVDREMLRRISQATGGRSYHSVDGTDLPTLVRTAVFSPPRSQRN